MKFVVLDTKNKLDDKLIVLSDKPARVTPKQFPIQVKFKQCCSFSDRKLLFELSKLTLHVQLSRQIVVAIKKNQFISVSRPDNPHYLVRF